MNDFRLLSQPVPFRPRRTSGEITPLASFESASRPGLYAHLVRQGSPTGEVLVCMIAAGHAVRTGQQAVEYQTTAGWPLSIAKAAAVALEPQAADPEDVPAEETTGKQLKERAKEVGCDLAGISKKADMQAAIREHLGK